MSAVQSVGSEKLDKPSKPTKRPRDVIEERKSKELVIAFAGPIGSGITTVKERFEEALKGAGYKVHHIKLSDYIKQCLEDGLVKVELKGSDKADRYIRLQNAGNELRKIQGDILSEYAIGEIAHIRRKATPHTSDSKGDGKTRRSTDFVPERNAYLIDQLKHQDEVSLFRALYGNIFYLFGVLSTSTRRANRLIADGVSQARIDDLIERDRKQREKNGQQLDRTLQLADFFLRNDHANAEEIELQIERSINLIHGVNGISPTKEEYGMYTAYASGLRSACLSRQIGASIMDDNGLIIATGRNDVPKSGGGLYGPEDGTSDARCVKLEGGKCFNDFYKHRLVEDIKAIVRKSLDARVNELEKVATTQDQKYILSLLNSADTSSKIAQLSYDETRLGGLIEFSRSIHAEMDAIVSIARKGGGSAEGSTLFTYTFPCHNCARHIVAAGIKRVYYLEPYEKSLAKDLHGDAIDVDGQRGGLGDGFPERSPVEFIHFEGVAPRQYLNMFTPLGERKDDNGKSIRINVQTAEKKAPEYLDDYRHYELKVVEHLHKVLEDLKAQER